MQAVGLLKAFKEINKNMQELLLILKILGLSSMVHLWVVSEPTQLLRDKLGLNDMTICHTKWKQTLSRFLNCQLCVGFWVGLFAFQNLPLAALISVLSVIISNISTPKLF